MSKWNLDTIDIGLIDEAELNANQMTEQAFERLVTNIKQSGGLSSAIGCYKRENGRFVIISGHHRYRACVKLRYKEVPVIYADENDLTKDEIIALQLSHNSLHGDDNKGILKRLFEEIQSVDFKEFANVDINEIKSIDVDSVSFVAECEHFTISFVLYRKDYDALKDLLGIVQEENEHSDMVVLADGADTEQPLLSLMREISKKYKVKSSNISFAKILELAKRQLSITKTEAND